MIIQYISQYLEYLEIERGLSSNTVDAYRRDLFSFADFFLENSFVSDLNQVQRIHLNMYIKKLYDSNYSPRSITREIASIKGFFKWLNINDIICHNPALAIEQPKLPKRLPKVLTLKEIMDLLNKEMNLLDKAVLELLYASGLRVSELVNIPLVSIDLNAKILRCVGKGAKERIVPIGKQACIAISDYLNERDFILKKYNIKSKYCFIKQNGKKLTRQDVYTFINSLGKI